MSTVSPLQQSVITAPFELLVEGDSGGQYPKRQEVITSQSDWVRYWDQVHAGLRSIPPILPVDFTSSNVLALSEGPQSTSGYNLEIHSVETSAAGTVVDVAETTPGPTCRVTDSFTNRYFIARTGKLPEPVSFRITTQQHTCQ
jgi:hypothetical protein